MKKALKMLLCLLTVFILSAVVSPQTVFAYDYLANDIEYSFIAGTNNLEVTVCNDKDIINVIIPNAVDGHPVTKIGDLAFQNCGSLTGVTIPDSVNVIGNSAFASTGLTSVTIPDSVTIIPTAAFHLCDKLESVTIPDGVEMILGSAFQGCVNLKGVTIPDSVKYLGSEAFESSGLTSVTIPDSVTEIKFSAFASTAITSVTIPDSVTIIDESVFQNCGNLTTVTIPDTVTVIRAKAFSGCLNLYSILYQGSKKQWAGITKETDWNKNCEGANIIYGAYDVEITAGAGIETAGTLTQAVKKTNAMTDMEFTAVQGYYFPQDYSVSSVNGVSVKRNGYTSITVQGTPTDDAAIALTAATSKNTPDAPVVGKTDCTTKDNNDGKITGVDSSMEYQVPGDSSWYSVGAGVDEISGCSSGTYYVRYKETDTSNASEAAEVVIKKFSVTITLEPNDPAYGKVMGGGAIDAGDPVTCEAEPNEGYVFDCWTEGGSRVDGARATYVFNAEQSRTLVANFRKVLIGDIASQAYTGDPVSPTGFTVELEGVDAKLQEGTDYDITYADNENAGTEAKAILTFKGDFYGTAVKEFTITPADITEAEIKLDSPEYEYEGKEIKPVPTITWNGKQLAQGTDFTLSYTGNVEPGTATVTVTGKGNFTGTNAVTFKITPGTITGVTVKLEKEDYEYEGKEIRPVPTVTLNGKALTVDTDFTLSYSNNVEPGTAAITITGKGSFKGTKTISFNILKREAVIKVDDAFKKLNEADPVFTGTVEGLIASDDLGEITYYRTNTDEDEGIYHEVLSARYTASQYYTVTLEKGDFTIVNEAGYTVTFEDGAGRTEVVTNVYGNYTLPKCMFIPPDGQIFDCWTVNGTDHNEGDTITVTADTTVTAKWKEIPPHDHIVDLVEAKEATCTEDGNKVYYACSICGMWFEDATAIVEIRDRDSVIIKALGHKWDKGVVTKEATYTEEGIRTFTCLNDASHTKTEPIPKKGRSSGGSGGSGSSSSVGSRSASSGSGSWNQDDTGWHYTENGVLVKNAWRYISYNGVSYWYFFDETGTMKTGWLDWNGERYYLYPVSDGWKGRMVTGWQKIDGKWYFFETASGSAQGRMYRSEKTPDGYYAGPDGAWDGNPAGTGR